MQRSAVANDSRHRAPHHRSPHTFPRHRSPRHRSRTAIIALDAVTQGVLGEGPLARPLADVARLVGVGEVVVELPPQLAQVVVHHHLFPRGEEVGELVLGVHHLARRARRELEGPRVHPDDVVHRVMVVERERRPRVHRELGPPPHRPTRHHRAHLGSLDAVPAPAPEAHRMAGQLAHEARAVGVGIADEADRRREAPRLLRGQLDRVVLLGHAVHRQIVQVAQARLLERPQRVALLGEEGVVGLDAVERDHP